MTVFDRIAVIAGRELGVSPTTVKPNSRREDFASWDSLKHLNLLMAIETEFGFRFTLDEMASVTSIADLVVAATGRGVRP